MALQNLPPHLRHADPKTYPDYEDELKSHLGDMTVVVTSPGPSSSGTNPLGFDFWRCAGELAGFVATTAIPVVKIIDWIRRARRIWGSIANIRYAIRSGSASRELGAEAVAVLEGVLGLGGVRKHCF